MGVPTPFDVLVTGSSGHLGTALMLQLPILGFKPLGIDILASPTTHHTGSISDVSFVNSIIAANPSIQHVLHTATLHKPHVGTHSQQAFVDTNITGTLTLLHAAADSLPNLRSFIFISSTTTFGAALSPTPGSPAAWIDESVTPQPKNIYGVTKCAAEDLCLLTHRQRGIPVLVLRVARFFPEEDDNEERRTAMTDDNLKVLELAYRRCDLADIVDACHCAMKRARDIGWGKYIISAPPPFPPDAEMLRMLSDDPQKAYTMVAPEAEAVFEKKGWKFLASVDRVYDSSKAVRELGWAPKYTFAGTVEKVGRGEDWRSQLAVRVGKKGYHAFSTGVYTKRDDE